MSTLLSGTASGLIGISNLQSLFSMETIQGILQFVGGIMNGQIGLKDIAGSVGAAFKEPFVYLAEHSVHVWKGNPTDQQVYEYGQNMGTVLQMVAGTLLGGGALGVKAAQTIAKVCPKLVKAVELYRKVANVGDFKGLAEPMQLKNVKNVANDAGVGLNGVKIKIDRNPEMVGTGYTGHASGNTITLYPDAFSSKENLVRTLAHERMHLYQESIFGKPNSMNLIDYETGATLSEDSWWQFFLQGGK